MTLPTSSKRLADPVAVIDVGGEPVEVRRKDITRMYLRLDERGRAVVTAPRRTRDPAIAAFVTAKRGWLETQRARRSETVALPPSDSRDIEGLRARVERLLALWEAHIGVSVARLTLRPMRTRWGSCTSATRRITLNSALAHLPDDLLEYVVVHELTHFDEQNHGVRFYALMSQRLPDWKDRRRRLAKIRL